MGNASTKQHRVDSASRQSSEKILQKHQFPSSIDGGKFTPVGLYPGASDDYNHDALRKIISKRLLAPIYRGIAEPLEAGDAQGAASTDQDVVLVPDFDSEDETPLGKVADLIQNRSESAGLHHASDLMFHISQTELYSQSVECPICFLYYPRNINYSTCCQQPICTECFIQIKRPESTMDPANCPYCTQPHFSVYYIPPQKLFNVRRRQNGRLNHKTGATSPISNDQGPSGGIPVVSPTKAANEPRIYSASAPMASAPIQRSQSSSSIARDEKLGAISEEPVKQSESNILEMRPEQRRKLLLGENSQTVSADDIRPDWQQKHRELLLERAQNQQRQLRVQLLAASRQQTVGAEAGLSRDDAYDLRRMEDLSGAAATVAALVEHLSGVQSNGSSHASISSTSSHGSNNRSNRSGGRSMRAAARHPTQIETAMRSMTSDMEELMLMEAVRRSLLDAEDQRLEQQQQLENVQRQNQSL